MGAILEGYATVEGDAVKRSIYVVDIGVGSTGDQVALYRYQKTKSVSNGSDQVTVELTKTVHLPLAGGVNARCSMAANDRFVYIGTDQSSFAV